MSWFQQHNQLANNVIYLFRDHVTSSPVTPMCKLDTFAPKVKKCYNIPPNYEIFSGADVQISSSGRFSEISPILHLTEPPILIHILLLSLNTTILSLNTSARTHRLHLKERTAFGWTLFDDQYLMSNVWHRLAKGNFVASF